MVAPQIQIVVTVRGGEVIRRTVPPGDYVIGSGENADVVVRCDGVSARHAQLTVNFNEHLIEDLGSKNGVFVNGRKVAECVRLWPNQKIQIGEAVIEMHRLREQGDGDLPLTPQIAAVRRALPEELLRERKYEIGGLVAEGGMGAILSADEATTGRTVAMKVVHSNPSPGDLIRLIKEAQITSQLEHPNIVPLHELGVDEHDQVFYTMKMIQGLTLKQILEIVAHGTPGERSKYPLTQLLNIFQKVCDAIGFAHSRSVIHRDLKPDNIMVGEYGEVLVMDWGLAKVLGEAPSSVVEQEAAMKVTDSGAGSLSASATMAGSILGTPQYMPPEQARGDVDLQDQRSDVYSLGAILYQILALRPPVIGRDAEEIIAKVRGGAIEPLHAAPVRSDWPIPESLAAVALRAMAMDADQRYASVPALQKDIVAYQRGFATAAEDAGLRKQLALLLRRHRREAAILAAGVVALLGMAAFAFAHVTRERSAATQARKIAETERGQAQEASAHAVADRARAETERNRANAALAELRQAAPAFQGQAGTLVEEQKFDEALEKNRLAIQLVPDDAGYHLFRAHTLAAMQRLPEAVESYRRVLELRPGDAEAKPNLELCQRLLTEAAGKPLDRAQQTQLLEAILAQKRTADSVLLAQALGRQAAVGMALIQTRLKSLAQQEKWNDARLTKQADGAYALDLSDLSVPDLSLLQGLPIGSLKLGRGTVTDLSPLASLPLKELDCADNPVRDLAPLQKLPIERLNISGTKVTDLTALAHLPLQQLSISFTEITDLAPLRELPLQTLRTAGLPIRSVEALRGLRLRELDLFACRQLTDLTPLAALAELQSVNLPAQINDLGFVRQLRSLQRLGNSGAVADGTAFDKLPTVAQFFATQGQRLASEKQFGPRLELLRNLLRKYGAPESKIAAVGLDSEGFLDLDIAGLAMPDLSSMSGLPIRRLVIRGTGATVLTPLSGMPLVSLDASENPLSNLAPLSACPALKILDIHGTNVADLRPLAALKLERLVAAGTHVQDIATLRGLPLAELDLVACADLTTLAPLAGAPRLETLLAPGKVADATILRQIPNLKRFANQPLASFDQDWSRVPSVKVFLAATDRLDALLAALRKFGMTEDRLAAIHYSPDGTLDLNLSNLPIEDLSFLKGLPVRRLQMQRTKVTNLAGLEGMPLEVLEAYQSQLNDVSVLANCQTLRSLRVAGTQVSDLTPVLHLPITDLTVRASKIADLTPLAAFQTLENIELSKDTPGIEVLRKLPRLQYISDHYDGKNHRPDKTAEEFWREYDAPQKAKK
ncbi:MAG: protein kinase [Chthoniobacter sp.]|uniref:protein kinase domain-containing protein n=1 Tax=Chthoniobacter sp. TaxID=2510640 RepID=UPI0032A7A229